MYEEVAEYKQSMMKLLLHWTHVFDTGLQMS
jgi:hypothetical protein